MAAVGRGASGEKDISGVRKPETLSRSGKTGTLRAQARRGKSEIIMGYLLVLFNRVVVVRVRPATGTVCHTPVLNGEKVGSSLKLKGYDIPGRSAFQLQWVGGGTHVSLHKQVSTIQSETA